MRPFRRPPRSASRKTEGLKLAPRQITDSTACWPAFARPRQPTRPGAGVLAARDRGRLGRARPSARNSGITSMPRRPGRPSAQPPIRIGPSRYLAYTRREGIPITRSISPPKASGLSIARLARYSDITSPWRRRRAPSTDHHRSRRTRFLSAPARHGPRVRDRSRRCAFPAICNQACFP